MVEQMEDLDDGALAAALAHAAGQILLSVRQSKLLTGKTLGGAGDSVANEFLCAAIAAQRPDDGLLSEESKDTSERLSKSRVWIIDPVDGTREYGEERADWAVHVGLSVDGDAVLGAVALPGLDLVMRSDKPITLAPPVPTRRIAVSRTRPPSEATSLADHLNAELVPMGSAGAKAMAVVRGEADIYVHSGGQYEWDNCAPAAVALAHGLHCSRIDGSPLCYNNKETYLPDLLICHREDAQDILKFLNP